MRFINFTLSDDNIGLETQSDGYLDLHNNFDLVNFQYDFLTRGLKINWKKSKGDWVANYSFDNFRLEFRNVTLFKIKELDSNTLNDFPEDDTIISQIGLTTKDDIDFIGVLPHVDINNDNEAMCLFTENGQAFIIYSEEVEFIKEK